MKIEWERQQVFFYWLCNVPGIGDKTIDRLLEKVSWPEALYYAKEEDLQAWREEGLWTEKQLRSFRSARRSGNLYSEYDKLQAAGIKMYPFYHPDYPERLQNIPQRPAVLFVKGKLPSEEKKVSRLLVHATALSTADAWQKLLQEHWEKQECRLSAVLQEAWTESARMQHLTQEVLLTACWGAG